VIVVDTSALIASLAGERLGAARMKQLLIDGERLVLPALALYEWQRGPRRQEELAAQEALLPSAAALPFDAAVAETAARLYRSVSRPRGREMDLAIAAHAVVLDAELWTLNREDFADIPGLRLV